MSESALCPDLCSTPDAATPRFIHLRLHSEYSVTDGIVRLDDAVARAVSFGPEETGLELPAWGGQMHGPNECANEEQLKQALKIYIVAILRLNELEL